jgi:hypothetical protein
MASGAREWIGAASCFEGPRPAASFADLPRKHQHEMLRFAFAGALSTACFVAAGLLARPLPSRSLAAHAALPDATNARAALLDMRPVMSTVPPRRPLAERGVGQPATLQRATVQLASLSEPLAEDSGTVPAPPRPERRRNILGRLFHVFHNTPPVTLKAGVP